MKILIVLWTIVFAVQGFAQQQKVTINFSVLDKNNSFDGDLKDSDFEVKHDGKRIQPISIEKITNETIHFVVMIDASGSQETTLEAEKLLALEFVKNALNPSKDKLAIVKFSQDIELIQDFASDISNASKIINTIELQELGKRNTSLWDSIQKVAELLAKIPSETKRAIVIISDGEDNFSKTKLDNVAEYLMGVQIPVFGMSANLRFWNVPGLINLDLISRQTGGFAVFPKNSRAVQNDIAKIEQAIRKTYKLTFLADNSKQSDKMQKIKISIINPSLKNAKLKIIRPEGFFFSNPK